VLGRDVLVLELLRLVEGAVEHLAERVRDLRLQVLGALHRGLAAQALLGLCAERVRRGARALDEGTRQLLVEQREQQVLGVDLRVAGAASKLLRGGDGLLALDGQLLEVHVLLLCVSGCWGRL
jgi:hypothetical protein